MFDFDIVFVARIAVLAYFLWFSYRFTNIFKFVFLSALIYTFVEDIVFVASNCRFGEFIATDIEWYWIDPFPIRHTVFDTKEKLLWKTIYANIIVSKIIASTCVCFFWKWINHKNEVPKNLVWVLLTVLSFNTSLVQTGEVYRFSFVSTFFINYRWHLHEIVGDIPFMN